MEPLGPDGDFGISGLGMRIAGMHGPTNRTETLEFVTRHLNQRSPWAAAALNSDIRRLAASPLSDADLETLWLSTTSRRFDPENYSGGIRGFLAEITDISSRFLRPGDVPAFERQTSQFDPEGIRQRILEEISSIREPLLARCDPLARDAIIPLLQRAVNELGSDLGMRLFLRALKTSFARMGLARLARFEMLGEQLGYSDLVVADGTLNTFLGPND
ncbi:hypothetical protein ACFVT9_35970 [Kitasatospora cineracea]|uniref:hypothetical protein n=1 Tax=Kitasatospora cineracea TaxID=88074 RepID=UPI0036DDBCC6